MDSQNESHGCEVHWRGLAYAQQLSHLTRHILKQGMVAFCGISLLCQQGADASVLSGNAIKHIQGSHAIAYQYDAWSRLTNRTLPNGVSTVYRYDKYGGVSNITHYQTPQQQKVITGFSYIYNQGGNIRQRVRIDGLGQQAIEQYAYDDDNNLKDYQCSGALCPHDAQGKVITYQHYTFNELNNIKTVASNNTLTTYEYDQKLPTRLVGYHNSNPTYPNSHKLNYDHNGNILQDDQGNVISYSPLDQTHSVSIRQKITTYFYNGEGRQVGEGITRGQTKYFIYGQSNLLNIRAGNQKTSFLYGANRLGKKDDDGIQYYLTDQGQSVVNTISQTKKQSENIISYTYSPYGIESDQNKQASNVAPIQHFGFDGQLTDSQTNWQFLGQGYRAYNPMLHRFMSQDSLSPFDKGGINGYVYGSNNPIMMSDPTGHMSFWENMGIGLVMGMIAGALTSEMGGWGALAINSLAGAVGSNIDAINNAAHRKAINWKGVGINAGIGAALGLFFGGTKDVDFDQIFNINGYPGIGTFPAIGLEQQRSQAICSMIVNDNVSNSSINILPSWDLIGHQDEEFSMYIDDDNLLGEGAFGKVYRYNSDGRRMALKFYRLTYDDPFMTGAVETYAQRTARVVNGLGVNKRAGLTVEAVGANKEILLMPEIKFPFRSEYNPRYLYAAFRIRQALIGDGRAMYDLNPSNIGMYQGGYVVVDADNLYSLDNESLYSENFKSILYS